MKEGVSIERYKEAREMIMQLEDIETQSMLILVESMIAGETHQEAAEKAAAFMRSQGREKQAQGILNTAKTFAGRDPAGRTERKDRKEMKI